jgi:8-oxo-dGTP diphosphatase
MSSRVLRFCGYCGGLLEEGFFEGHLRKKCIDCRRISYQNPIPAVALIATKNEKEILLVRRTTEPEIGCWCLPGGFIELGETPIEAVHRELSEETGLHCTIDRLFEVGTVINGYYGDVVVLCYLITLAEGTPQPGDDADRVEFFPVEKLPSLAFQSHMEFIEHLFSIKIGQHPTH